MTTYYRNDKNQVFSFQAEVDYESHQIHGYEIILDSGEEIYKGTIKFNNKSDEEFEQDVDSFIKQMKAKLEPNRVLLS